MKYTERNRKTLKLPSGATIVIAKLNTYCEPFIARRAKEEEQEAGSRLAKYCLTNPANGPFQFEGEPARIVDKPMAGEGEISITDLDQADADAIVNGIIEFSGLTKAGAEARKTFPEGSKTGGEPPPGGEALRNPADGAAQDAVG